MGKYSALTIAKWFLWRNQMAVNTQGGDEMSLLKLLKLLYYAEGCSLGLGKGSLFSEPILAWEHGPVVESVWRNYSNAYQLDITEEDYAEVDSIQPEDAETLEAVFQHFGKYSAWGLRNMTHMEDPWKITTNDGQFLNGVIDRELIRQYFVEHYIAS